MFTIKLYSDEAARQVIRQAESFTILRCSDGTAEITLHQRNASDDSRVDIADANAPCAIGSPQCYARAIIENAAGKTTEIIDMLPSSPLPRAA